VPAFAGLLAPHWVEDARGVLLGMTGGGHVMFWGGAGVGMSGGVGEGWVCFLMRGLWVDGSTAGLMC